MIYHSIVIIKFLENNLMKKRMVPRAGIEPARYFYRGILSPLRLPISPPGHIYKVGLNIPFLFKLNSASPLRPLPTPVSHGTRTSCTLRPLPTPVSHGTRTSCTSSTKLANNKVVLLQLSLFSKIAD